MPIAFVNTISKSGTHLAMRAVSMLPGMGAGIACPAPQPYLCPEHSGNDLTITLARLEKGGYFCGHIGYREWLSQILEQKAVRTILVVRDPRDVLVSTMLWIEKFTGHHFHDLFSRLPRQRRLNILLAGGAVANSVTDIPSLAETYEKFLPWVSKNATLVVRYEDLVGEPGGGTKGAQCFAIAQIAQHLGFQLPKSSIELTASRVERSSYAYNQDPDNGLRGRIGLWREGYFCDELTKMFESLARRTLSQWEYC